MDFIKESMDFIQEWNTFLKNDAIITKKQFIL